MCIIAQSVNRLERRKIELELRNLISESLQKPSECKNLEQIRYCIQQVCLRIEQLEAESHTVPQWLYALLAQYNARQNSILLADFIQTYP